MLSLITFLPIVGAIVLLFFPKDQLNIIRWTALGIAIVSLVLSIIAVLIYSQVSLSAPFTGSTFYLVQKRDVDLIFGHQL